MTRPLYREKGLGFTAFWLVLLMGLALFLPFVLFDKGYFIYYGDFNAQQIPFYQLAHRAVRAGEIGWNWYTDLGVNFVGSYSFYLLGSPFFWLTLPFPTAWVPYLMAPLLVLKLAFASLTCYGYTSRFLRPRLALTAGVLYAFCGFSLYNVFFNHFHEAMIFFPLMLLGMEQYMQDGKRGLFALSVLLSALSNYYFFIGQALFLMIYWVIRSRSGDWEHCGRRFFGLWLEALLGTAGAAVLLLPSYYAVIQNGRTDILLEGWGLLIHSSEQRPLDILHSFFFLPDHPARANFFPDANNNWASMSAWVPVFGATGAIAYFQSRRHNDWLRRLLIILVIFAFIPGLNGLFQLLNYTYYARWFYMLTLMLILATLRCFEEDRRVEWGRAFGWSGGITAVLALAVGLLPKSWKPNPNTGTIVLGLYKNAFRFWLVVGIAVICLILTAILVRYFRKNKDTFYSAVSVVCAFACLLCGWGYLTFGKATGSYPSQYVTDKLLDAPAFVLPQDDFSRIDSHEGMDNQGMYWQMPSIRAFHSIVPGSVMEFYPTVGVERSVASRPNTTHYALRSLLSVRWLFDYTEPEGDVQLAGRKPEEAFQIDGETAMPGWTYYDTQNGFAIYENENYIPMGFTYDGYITRTDYNHLTAPLRELVLLRALVVEDEDETVVAKILPRLEIDPETLNEETYAEDCQNRADGAANAFSIDADGFRAVLNLEQQNLVFFSVPYEEGWSATVNGKTTDILKTNVGFMAVVCPAGESVTIRFDYETPGLRHGIYLSGGALVMLLIYWLFFCRRKGPEPFDPTTVPLLPPARKVEQGGFDLYAIYHPENHTKD